MCNYDLFIYCVTSNNVWKHFLLIYWTFCKVSNVSHWRVSTMCSTSLNKPRLYDVWFTEEIIDLLTKIQKHKEAKNELNKKHRDQKQANISSTWSIISMINNQLFEKWIGIGKCTFHPKKSLCILTPSLS